MSVSILVDGLPEFGKVPEVAAALSISSKTVWRMVDAGELPAIRFGRAVRIPRAAVAEYIRGQLEGRHEQ